MSVGHMGGDAEPTRADVEAMNLWTSFNFGDGAKADKTYSDGRILISSPNVEAAQEVEESVRVREERHTEGQAKILRSFRSAVRSSRKREIQEPEQGDDTEENEPL